MGMIFSRLVDLTRPMYPGQPKFPTDPDMSVSVLHPAGPDGFEVLSYRLVGPWGTHVDAPGHAVPGARTLAEITPSELILPLAVIPLVDAPSLTAAHVLAWEREHGPVPAGGFVALHTGWADHTSPDTPGWALDAVELLHARGVRAIGHDTLNTDPGPLTASDQYPAQRFWLSHDHWQVEFLTHLDQVPATGATMWVSWPVPAGGSSFPARALAVLP
ncbi:Kynurenine formamidase [Corynebacterium comes]|uniref:Kynurenine formamidase n=2 Tax=Corynebacterium comes TaxID=2675218 RepID=A0A6B8VLV9_9CORY|nr:Kynurenine formamidase [Corynebacterium comes]